MSADEAGNKREIPAGSSRSDEDTESAEVALLEVEPGVAILFGTDLPQGWEVEPFGLGKRADAEIVNALSGVAATINVVTSGIQGLVSAQGLVRLAPETIRNLRSMQVIAKDGYYLGTLTRGSKFAAQVRWAPAVGAQAASVMESLGPSLALLAISAQLTMISKKIDENAELTRNVLEELHKDHWDALRGVYATVVGAVDEARDVGAVTPRIFDRVRSLESSIRAERNTFNGYIDKHLANLDSGYSQRREYLSDNAQRIIGDIQGLIMAETAHCGYQMLRAAEIANDEHRSPEDEKLMRRLARQVPVERQKSLERVERILQELDAQCHLAAELTGRSWSLPDLWSRRSNQVDRTVRAMTDHVTWLRGTIYEEPTPLNPSLWLHEDDADNAALKVLRWLLLADEPLLALAEVSVQGGLLGASDGYLGVTPGRIFLSSKSDLLEKGILEQQVPIKDIRYVRLKVEDKRAVLDVITKDQDLTVRLGSWALTEQKQPSVEHLADLLMSAANLPKEERRCDWLLTNVTSRQQMIEGATPPTQESA